MAEMVRSPKNAALPVLVDRSPGAGIGVAAKDSRTPRRRGGPRVEPTHRSRPKMSRKPRTDAPMAEAECPRERLLRSGPRALSDAELLALLLSACRPGVSALDFARQLLQESGGLCGLVGVNPLTLQHQSPGGSDGTALLAALELACRLAQGQIPDRTPLTRPDQVAHYLCLRYGNAEQKVLGALWLDTRHRLIGEREVFRGTFHRAAVEPRPLLKEALLRNAASILMFHTHPSGDPTPSPEDRLFSRRMAEACQLVGVELLDHLVLGGPRWLSRRQRVRTSAAGRGAVRPKTSG
jgi:DNA repair protein RadC